MPGQHFFTQKMCRLGKSLSPFRTAAQHKMVVIVGIPAQAQTVQIRVAARMAQSNGQTFVVHAGDIKNGSSTCNDTVYQDILETFQKSRHPFVYVPGDNEWTDCHHKLNTAYDPLERLEKLRSVFFSGKSSLGNTKIKLSRQSEQPDFLQYRENVRWEMGGILFATVNLPGSRNNFFGTTLGSDTQEGPSAEFVQRSRANSKWMADAFALAREKGIRGLVLIGHANPGFERFKSATADPSYHDFLEQLRSETQSFNGEVVFVHGDTHNQHVDQPLVDSKTDSVVQNFTRVETFGSPYFGWIRGEADPTRPKVFNFTPRLFATEPGR